MKDKISTKSLLSRAKMLSVNQLNAQIKITEAWKAMNEPNHPLKIRKITNDNVNCTTRAVTKGDVIECGKTELVQSTFLSDASKAWNNCTHEIKTSVTLWSAKKAIRKFVETLPI